MNRIAFVIGEKFLYWNPILLTLGAVCAILIFIALSGGRERKAALAAVPLALILSLIFSRFVHWYCRPEGYESALKALTDYHRGSYALIGVFAGCLLTALLLRLFRVTGNLPGMLDRMAVAGSLGICVGRLSFLFTAGDRGILLPEWVPFPLATRIVNSVSGATEVRLAVFLFQFAVAGILFLALMTAYLHNLKKRNRRDGDFCLIFLLWYCGSQAVLDSPRYDSLYFRSNGFVSIVQIFGILTVITVLVIFAVRMIRAAGKKNIWMPILTLPLLGGAGYMEYHVQRHGSEALFAYSVMGTCMLAAMILGMCMYFAAGPAEISCRDLETEEEEKPLRTEKKGHYQGKFSARK